MPGLTPLQVALKFPVPGPEGGEYDPPPVRGLPLTMRARSESQRRGCSRALEPMAYGGTPPYRFAVQDDPSGVLSTTGGVIAIAPSLTDHPAGAAYAAVVTVIDALGKVAAGSVTVTTEAAG